MRLHPQPCKTSPTKLSDTLPLYHGPCFCRARLSRHSRASLLPSKPLNPSDMVSLQNGSFLGYRDSSSADARLDSSVPASQEPPSSDRDAEVAAAAVQGELWSEAMQLKEARERAAWHEKMSRSNIEQSEALQVFHCPCLAGLHINSWGSVPTSLCCHPPSSWPMLTSVEVHGRAGKSQAPIPALSAMASNCAIWRTADPSAPGSNRVLARGCHCGSGRFMLRILEHRTPGMM